MEPRGWGGRPVAWLNRCVLPKSYSRWATQKEKSSFQEVVSPKQPRTEHTLLHVYFGKGRTELGFPGPQMSGMMNSYIHKRTSFLRRDLCLEGLTQRYIIFLKWGLSSCSLWACRTDSSEMRLSSPKASLGSLPRAKLLETRHFTTSLHRTFLSSFLLRGVLLKLLFDLHLPVIVCIP